MGTQVVAAMTVIPPQQRSLKTIFKKMWIHNLFVICEVVHSVKFYTKGESVLQLCYATMLQHNHKCITSSNLLHYDFISVPPQLELRLGPAVNPRDLEEGDDVYFE